MERRWTLVLFGLAVAAGAGCALSHGAYECEQDPDVLERAFFETTFQVRVAGVVTIDGPYVAPAASSEWRTIDFVDGVDQLMALDVSSGDALFAVRVHETLEFDPVPDADGAFCTADRTTLSDPQPVPWNRRFLRVDWSEQFVEPLGLIDSRVIETEPMRAPEGIGVDPSSPVSFDDDGTGFELVSHYLVPAPGCVGPSCDSVVQVRYRFRRLD